MNWGRRAILFLLGLLLILDALIDTFRVVPFVAGCVMVGLIPIDYIIDVATRPAHDDAQLERLREVMKEKDD